MASILGFFSVSPACAGMIPQQSRLAGHSTCEPRMRGDDPPYRDKMLCTER